jgi:hypothetical protein
VEGGILTHLTNERIHIEPLGPGADHHFAQLDVSQQGVRLRK